MTPKSALLAAASVTAVLLALGRTALVADLPQTRSISLHNIHTDETLTIEYKRNGKFVPEAMEKVNWVLRDWRRQEAIHMDPALIDLLWEIHTELGSKVPIDVICGYRSRSTNEMLRRTVGGQASQSRHILGKAADVTFPDIPLKELRYAALVREKGGVGYYPTSGTPFVHIDTDRVRAWPRLPRFELALLFPNGHTQHMPAEGGPITTDDVKTARSRYHDLAVQIAAFLDIHKNGGAATTLVADAHSPGNAAAPKPSALAVTVAALTPPPAPRPAPAPQRVAQASPKLVAEPRLADRPVRLMPRPSEEDRSKLTQLAAMAAGPQLVSEPKLAVRQRGAEAPQPSLPSLTGGAAPVIAAAEKPSAAPEAPANPRLAFASAAATDSLLGWSTGFASAAAYDDDHPEEISYRPFPIATLLTASASVDDADLARLTRHDAARAIDMLDQTGSVPPMRLQPPAQIAKLMWAQKFSMDEDAMEKARRPAGGAEIADRRVKTEAER